MEDALQSTHSTHARLIMSNEIDTRPESIEARTIRKMRIRILPFIFLVYIICFLDRINIGFAALTMNKELAITSQQFGLLAGIFFFGYLLLEFLVTCCCTKSAPASGLHAF